MIRNLKALAVALMAAFAMSLVIASAAPAKDLGTHSGLFTANVTAGETAVGVGEQIGTAQMAITGLPPVTCSTVKGTGKALTKGPSTTEVTIETTYEGCHIVLAGLTKAVTVTMNGCAYVSDAKTTTTENTPSGISFDRTATVTVECPQNKQIELHVYAKATQPHSEILCTYDIGAQGPLSGITLTNKINTPTAVNDIEIEGAVSTVLTNTIKSAICGQSANPTGITSGKGTLRATNEIGQFVDASVSD
jgi:hypothetical protein